jgi:chromosome segregation ATPase
MLDFVSQNFIGLIALIVSLTAAAISRREISSRAKAEAIGQAKEEIVQLNARLEEEVTKLQAGLDRCIKDRVGLKEEIMSLKNSLKLANIEVRELNIEVEELEDAGET